MALKRERERYTVIKKGMGNREGGEGEEQSRGREMNKEGVEKQTGKDGETNRQEREK